MPASLYVLGGSGVTRDGGVCRLLQAAVHSARRLICSEKLSDDFGWDAVPPNHLVIVETGRTTSIRPFL